MKSQDAVAFFGEDIHEHAECVLTIEERGTHSSSEFSAAHFAKLRKSLRKSGATATVGPSTARQITRTRTGLNLNARIKAPGETPAALKLLRMKPVTALEPD